MKRDNVNYAMVGGFSLVMLILLIIFILKITGRGTNSDIYYIHYGNVAGVRIGTTVTYSGFAIGRLLDITPIRENRKTHYQLMVGIKQDWPIPTDSTAQVVSPGLLAESQIDITEGRSNTYLKPGDSITSGASSDMMAVLNSIGGEFSRLSKNGLLPLLKNLNKQVDGVGNDIPKLLADTNKLVTSLNKTADQLARVFSKQNSDRMSHVIKNSDDMISNLKSLSFNLGSLTEELHKLIMNSDKMISGSSKDLRQSIVDLRGSMSTVAQNIETIMYNLDTASRNISEFSHQIRANPGILLNGKPPKDEGGEK